MADLVRDFVALIRLSELLPESYEWLRRKAHSGDLPTETSGGRIFIERDFALCLIDLSEHLDFSTATQLLSAMTQHDEGLSTTISELAEIYEVSEKRMRGAATNAKGVEAVAGAVETDASGLVNLRDYLDGQTASA